MPDHTEKSVQRTIYSLKRSIYDGFFAQAYINLTGTIFLPAYALILGAQPIHIGILASLPFFGTLAQLPGSVIVEKYYSRKILTITFSAIARGVWIFLVLGSFLMAMDLRSYTLSLLIVITACSQISGSLSGVAWLSWMASLVPEEIRGRYFGLRNSILSIVTISITLTGGYFLDWHHHHFPGSAPTRSFEILFMAAIISGMISLYFLRQQGYHPPPGQKSSPDLFKLFTAPLRQENFRKFIRFALVWAFAVNFSSPFFIIYMLEDLKFSYTLVSLYTVCAALADFIGMGIWGHLSDRFGNRAIIIVSALVVTILPFIWIVSDTSRFSIYILIPLLQLVAGFFWAAYNLCAGNLVFRMAPKEQNSAFFAFWSISSANGAAAGLGAIMGGLLSQYTSALLPYFPGIFNSGFKIIFFTSFLLRGSSLLLIRGIREEVGLPVRKFVEVLRSVKAWTTMIGNHPLFRFFLPASDSDASTPYWPLWRKTGIISKQDVKSTSK
jgi:MFS family permease